MLFPSVRSVGSDRKATGEEGGGLYVSCFLTKLAHGIGDIVVRIPSWH